MFYKNCVVITGGKGIVNYFVRYFSIVFLSEINFILTAVKKFFIIVHLIKQSSSNHQI